MKSMNTIQYNKLCRHCTVGVLSVVICSPYGPGEEALCESGGVRFDHPEEPSKGQQVKQVLRQQDLHMSSREGRE